MAVTAGFDEERRAIYTDLVLSSLHEAARRRLEAIMRPGREYQSDFAKSYVAQGKKEGELKAKAEAVIAVLEARELEVAQDVRERILGSTDLAELDGWIRRAALVRDARELFTATAS
ncbi:hypothetical protein [Chondromyces crocatus]|uniref:Uncharacterized protein n=1 Tax=Chondromyces crocatus TaxID=52 RepID=A0A0K1ECV3_CHOCO|nr:hypothetical protein [Chondromyces crocatus]AKT38701.1 uncharacterized protein CMC5_028490 [Chondromyces crocatus]